MSGDRKYSANGKGVSGIQYESGGIGGVSLMLHLEKIDVVPGSGKVARRGVGGRGARHSVAEQMVREVGCVRAGGMLKTAATALSDRFGVL
jgi:hypothetical protein